MQTENIKSFEVKSAAVKDFYNHTHEMMKRLAWSARKFTLGLLILFSSNHELLGTNVCFPACRSWFKNGKTHGPVTAVYPGSRLHFFEVLKNVRWEDYEIEYKTGNRFQFMGNGFSNCESTVDGDPVWYFDDPFTTL